MNVYKQIIQFKNMYEIIYFRTKRIIYHRRVSTLIMKLNFWLENYSKLKVNWLQNLKTPRNHVDTKIDLLIIIFFQLLIWIFIQLYRIFEKDILIHHSLLSLLFLLLFAISYSFYFHLDVEDCIHKILHLVNLLK